MPSRCRTAAPFEEIIGWLEATAGLPGPIASRASRDGTNASSTVRSPTAEPPGSAVTTAAALMEVSAVGKDAIKPLKLR